jgi:hypothetical protein
MSSTITYRAAHLLRFFTGVKPLTFLGLMVIIYVQIRDT